MMTNLKKIATIQSTSGEEFFVNVGTTEKQIGQLINFANTDPEVRRFTSDPKRFRDRKAFDRWRKKGRVIYTLTDENDDLLGIIWLGKKEIPQRDFTENFDPQDYKVTFGIRIYGAARGKGLARPFMAETFNHFSPKGVWLETSGENIAAVRAYTNFGFRKITEPDESGKILMILPRRI